MTGDVGTARLLTRGTLVISAIGAHPNGLSLAALHRETGLAKPTLLRILVSLRESGFVALDRRGRAYVLGPALLDLLSRSEPARRLRETLRHELQLLADELERPIWHWHIEGHMIRPRDQFLPFGMSAQSSPRPAVRLDRSAAGVAVLAAMDAAACSAAIEELQASGQPTGGDFSLMLGFSAATGFAVRDIEDGAGGAELAAAVVDEAGQPQGALVVVFESASALDTEKHEVGRRLAFAARRISLGPRGAPRRLDVTRRTPRRQDQSRLSVLEATAHDKVGSSPYWDAARNRLVWIDSLGGAFNWWDPARLRVERRDLHDLPGAVAPYRDGRAVIASREGIALMDLETGHRTVVSHPEPEDALRRFSVARIGPDGRFWVGSLRPVPVPGLGQGRVYALAPDGRIAQVLNLERGAKGMAWSPDGRRLYLTEAGSKAILQFEMDPDTMRPATPRRFAVHDGDGTPNGIVVDAEGCLWAAIYGGWQVKRFDPEGRDMEVIDLPVPLPTALCFGGARRQDLFVTTCRLHVPSEVLAIAPASGRLLRIVTDVNGLRDSVFHIHTGGTGVSFR
jgi:sugar lactone lactonase YvrE/DNA-binding IclR family transcriptional regulator